MDVKHIAHWLAGATGGAAIGFFTTAGLSVFLLGGPNYGSWSWKSFATGALMTFFAILFFAAVASGAARDPKLTCRDPGPCLCTESTASKSIIGYVADNVSVTCINMQTMSVKYYTLRRNQSLGAYAGDTQ